MASGKRAWGAMAPRRRRPVGGAALLAALGAVVGVMVGASPRQGIAQEVLGGVLPVGAGAEILQVHNRERAAVGVAPLRWDPALAATALECAKALAASRQFRHCRSGENLWMGTAGRFTPAQMVQPWAAERRDFQPGTFPAVSRSGTWQAVGHYTQMVWRTTTTLGCAAATGADGLTRLVCHYAPPGNILGRPVF
ncbi:MAG: CAP domain-containing protein [Cyanobacteriota bacterium]|nr:CAP domain-containing protein [Cyanobacteriota bacterium]